MAKVTIEFDTNNKSMTVAVNGVAVDNVSDVSFYRSCDGDEVYCCGITTVARDQPNDLRIVTHLVASQEEGSPASKLPGFFVKSTRPKVFDDIQRYFK